MYVAEKEPYGAIKFALKEKRADIVSRLPSGHGYEVPRLLALKFDSVMPHLRQMPMSSIFGFADDKSKDFRATVLRIAHIEKTCNDMADQCGDRQGDSIVGDIFYQSRDSLSTAGLVH